MGLDSPIHVAFLVLVLLLVLQGQATARVEQECCAPRATASRSLSVARRSPRAADRSTALPRRNPAPDDQATDYILVSVARARFSNAASTSRTPVACDDSRPIQREPRWTAPPWRGAPAGSDAPYR